MRSPWRQDVKEALEELGGIAHLSDIYRIVRRKREEKGATLGQYDAWVRCELNHNCDGKGENVFERIGRGVYRLKK